MLEPTLVTWILVIIGVLIFLPVQYAHIILLLRPHDQKTQSRWQVPREKHCNR